MKKRLTMLCILLTMVFLFTACATSVQPEAAVEATTAPAEEVQVDETVEELGTIPEVSLRFATEPYPDHTIPYIAIDQEWFADVGITVSQVDSVDADKLPSVMVAGSYDFASGAPALFIPSMNQADFTTFCFSNMFLGYSVMAPAGTKTYSDFIAEGQEPADAIVSVMSQMKGQTFTYPAESAIKPFIDLCLEKGGLTMDDFKSEVLDDSNGVALMLAGRAQFKVGGVPATATLTSNGFIPILSSADIASAAEPSVDSIEIRSILHNGWTTTKSFAENNHDTILRLASVCFRMNQYVHDNPAEAAAIHVNYVNSIAGTNFSVEEVAALYASVLPLYTFDMQEDWMENTQDPLYWEYEIGSTIKMYEEQGIFEAGKYSPSDIVSANTVYEELKELKAKTDENLAQLEDAEGDAAALKEKAEYQYSIFDFLDAERFSSQALQLMGK